MILNIIEHFSTLPDTRHDHPSKLHKPIDITLCATLAKCDTWEEIADYAVEQHNFFLLTRQHLAGCSRFKQFLELLDHKRLNRRSRVCGVIGVLSANSPLAILPVSAQARKRSRPKRRKPEGAVFGGKKVRFGIKKTGAIL